MTSKNTYLGWARVFEIFAKYDPQEGYELVRPDHDIIYAGPSPELVSEEDLKELDVHGWMPDKSLDCFYKFT